MTSLGIQAGVYADFKVDTIMLTIAIVARGSQIDINVDQVGIARVTDSTYSQGGVGVIGWMNSDVVFSNAKLWTA